MRRAVQRAVRLRVGRAVRGTLCVFRLPGTAIALGVSVLLVGRILGSLVWFVGGLPVARRAAVCRFRRRLRRSGLDRETVDELTEDYARGASLFGSEIESADVVHRMADRKGS